MATPTQLPDGLGQDILAHDRPTRPLVFAPGLGPRPPLGTTMGSAGTRCDPGSRASQGDRLDPARRLEPRVPTRLHPRLGRRPAGRWRRRPVGSRGRQAAIGRHEGAGSPGRCWPGWTSARRTSTQSPSGPDRRSRRSWSGPSSWCGGPRRGWVSGPAIVADVLGLVADRFRLEPAFRDVTEVVGAGQQQVGHVGASVGSFPGCLGTFPMTECWAWDRAEPGLVAPRSVSPWDDKPRRPSHADKRRAWRRELLAKELDAVRRHATEHEEIRDRAERLLGLAAGTLHSRGNCRRD